MIENKALACCQCRPDDFGKYEAMRGLTVEAITIALALSGITAGINGLVNPFDHEDYHTVGYRKCVLTLYESIS